MHFNTYILNMNDPLVVIQYGKSVLQSLECDTNIYRLHNI